MRISRYEILTNKDGFDLNIAVVADLHSHDGGKILSCLSQLKPDIIVSPGDILERLDGARDDINEVGFDYLNKATKIAPYFYSFGNHELCGSHRESRKFPEDKGVISEKNLKKIQESKVKLLFDEYCYIDKPGKAHNLYIGGLCSGMYKEDKVPNLDFAKIFDGVDGFKILLCHHPEYYDKYFRDTKIDLFISGHAHGGQWRFFGQGIYAPNQGLFPKYTSGLHENRLLISRGVVNNATPIPRLFNPCEILSVRIISNGNKDNNIHA